ncbi:Lrp/AsnC family transcriptional regulator [Marinomonas mediterranea]|jgi:Transcriptional regulators|uniref:Transcriptional regulator, AsnC family n=1 Tax=Marinomonas mediterranea (strain ATCC 700492 / JCM 21426 / NBRC 103028 / MMB-1) TaxID=717774 RepID=F2JTV0_MARM1|nr:Lrp/AsnC family transcriptional regulator [Marinomonas mediterranea]ADZ92720.1 transcriptional regulator, AsnC family [Marinomonas mediterranea MMB-1]WCN10652.1 winged helix-turn-helix transcriptional regulator [Marinomonas mediterranea]WCN14709.1 winged helix-turn-helix transcriptional regulator [Marinomonas mediterranea]WCN18749.1 winged helix-turn-helix transcriptional regulator [Marinomonas mediterranea MMB-1]
MSIRLDHIDLSILRALQNDGRMTNAELAEQVFLSPTPCLRRVKRLEKLGVIDHYTAEINRSLVGIEISAFVFVQLQRNSKKNAHNFEQAVAELNEVQECFVVTGEYDYLLNVATTNLKSYDEFIKEKLGDIETVSKVDTTIVLNQVKSRRQLPL